MGKKSQSTSYANTTTSNPYVTSTTNNGGTVSNFVDGTALNSVYNFVNKNIDSLLNEYLNPTLNSTTNQAKLNAFANSLATLGFSAMYKAFPILSPAFCYFFNFI